MLYFTSIYSFSHYSFRFGKYQRRCRRDSRVQAGLCYATTVIYKPVSRRQMQTCTTLSHTHVSIKIISRLVISSAENKSIFGYHPRSVDSCNCNMIQNCNSLCCIWMESNCSSKMIIWIIRSSLSRKLALPSVVKEKHSTLAQIKMISLI